MSEENLETTQRMYEAYRRGDVDAVLAEMDAHVELVTFPEISKSPYVGHDGVRRLFEDQKQWDVVEFEAHKLRANGDCVAMLGRFRVRRGGALTDSSAGIAVILEGGRIVRSESYTSWESALRRCGLDPSAETAAVA